MTDTDADWLEALSPEAQKIVEIIESSIEDSDQMPIDPNKVQLREFFINYHAQGVTCEAEVRIRIVVWRCCQWSMGRGFNTLLSEVETEILLPMEIAEMIVSLMHPGEVVDVTRVVVSPLPDWARKVIGAEHLYPRFSPESIIEVMEYYEISDRPSYYYPVSLLEECLEMCDAWHVLDIFNKYRDNETIATLSVYALESCFKKSSLSDLFYYQQHYKGDCSEIADAALRALQVKCSREENLKHIVSTLLVLVLKGHVTFHERDRYALR